MRPNNPACYECPRTASRTHHWVIGKDEILRCDKCKLVLNQRDSDDCRYDETDRLSK